MLEPGLGTADPDPALAHHQHQGHQDTSTSTSTSTSTTSTRAPAPGRDGEDWEDWEGRRTRGWEVLVPQRLAMKGGRRRQYATQLVKPTPQFFKSPQNKAQALIQHQWHRNCSSGFSIVLRAVWDM